MSLDLGEYLSRSDAGQVLMEKGFLVTPEATPTKMMAEHVANMKHYAMSHVDNKVGSFHGVFSDPRLVHCQTSWKVRLSTLPVFSTVYGTPMSDLVLSVDGVAVGTHAAHKKEAKAAKICGMPYWLHVDVSAKELRKSDFRIAENAQVRMWWA